MIAFSTVNIVMLKFHQNGLIKFFGKLFCLICHYLTASLHSLMHKASTPFCSVSSFVMIYFFLQRGINLLPNPQPGGPRIVIHLAFHPMAHEGFLISKGKTIEQYGMGQTRWNLIYWHIFLCNLFIQVFVYCIPEPPITLVVFYLCIISYTVTVYSVLT